VIQLCLSPGVVPVFVPPREMGFQGMIEGYNGRWQARAWSRFQHPDLVHLQERSARRVSALREHRAARIEAAPARRPFPANWKFPSKNRPRGRLVLLRALTDELHEVGGSSRLIESVREVHVEER
jgi:hypothetical protein